MLHEDFGVPKHRAFLYAHLANPFYSGYGLAFTDYMGVTFKNPYGTDIDYNKSQPAPCVNLTADQFKKLWNNSVSPNMNSLLTHLNHGAFTGNTKVEGLKNLNAPYDCMKLYALFDAGDYKGFIQCIEDSYKPEKKKKDGKTRKKKTANS